MFLFLSGIFDCGISWSISPFYSLLDILCLQPICTIATIIQAQSPEEAPRRSIYMSSFTEQDGGPRELIHKSDVEKERLKDSIGEYLSI